MELDTRIKDELSIEDPSIQPISKALSDGSREETPLHSYKHKWTVEQRITLAMLAENYINNWDELTIVFNHFHKSDLRRCQGLRKAVIYTQYRDMRMKFDAAAALRHLQISLSPYDRTKLASRAHLERKANDIGVQLIAMTPTSTSNRLGWFDKHDPQGHKKRKRGDSTDFLSSRSEDESGTAAKFSTVHGLTSLPKTPTKAKGKQPDNGFPTPPDSKRRKIPTAGKRLAQVGFRASTSESQGTYSSALGIRAGAFLNYTTIPSAGDLTVTQYREEALHHVTKHDHSRPSMFVSVTKNPIRAIHMLFHARDGENGLCIIDLNAADKNGNVEKANDLKLRTTFRYTAAGEYLIFGGVDPRAIISYIPASMLLANITLNEEDPFRVEVLQAHKRLSYVRRAITKDLLPMTYSLGRAVGQLVGTLYIPPKHFETAVWAFVQDYKFYNAEGGKRGHWTDNMAFKDGAVQGYQAVRNDNLASLEIENSIKTAREVIEIEDDSESDQVSDSDLESSHEDVPIPAGVEDWIRNTEASQASLQYFDLETSKWMSKEEDLSNEFLKELRDVVGDLDNQSAADRHSAEHKTDIPGVTYQARDIVSNAGYDRLEMDMGSPTRKSFAIPAKNVAEESRNLDELCADVMNMHGDGRITSVQASNHIVTKYEFGWTGM